MAVLDVVRERVLPLIERHGAIRHWIIDDTGVPKKGKLSVGVARQYCGQLGKRDNCQVAVTLSVANEQASLPIAYRLYLPQSWADDPERRGKAGVPEDVRFETKPQIALAQIRAALDNGVPRGLVLSDAGYGNDTDLRAGLTELGLLYVVGVQSSTSLWPPGQGPLAPKPWSGTGRPPKLMRRDTEHQPLSALELAKSLSVRAWRTIRWREGTKAALSSRFAAVRVRGACPAGASGLLAQRAACRGMAADRVAGGGEGAHQVLAVHRAGRHHADRPGHRRKGALAH